MHTAHREDTFAAPTGRRGKSTTVQIRLATDEDALLDAAASRKGTTKSALLREHGIAAAHKIMEETTTTYWTPAAFEALHNYLNQPPRPNAKMAALLNAKAPWEE